MITDWIASQSAFVQALIRVVFLLLPLLMLVPGMIWWERRLLSWMQDRIGPNRVATYTFGEKAEMWVPGGKIRWTWPKRLQGKKLKLAGLLQPIADGVKLFLKEDITPTSIDRVIYFVAPAVALFPAFAIAATLPWGPNPLLTPVADVNIGILYVLAISSLGVYGVVLAGYGSNNKYSLLGGLRASAQLISYELAMGMSLAAVVLATGSLKMTEMVKAQEAPLWGAVPALQNWFLFTPYGALAGLIFLVCAVAETNRAPFDLPEAENELIAGYHTEYSSMKFAVFFMGEYAAMFVFGGIFAAVFLGGYNMLPLNWDVLAEQIPSAAGLFTTLGHLNLLLAPVWFLGKCVAGITVYIWLRATLPRLRYDQLMSLGWRSLLPMAVANFLVVALWIVCTAVYGPSGGWIAVGLAAGVVLIGATAAIRISTRNTPMSRPRAIQLVEGRGVDYTEGVAGG